MTDPETVATYEAIVEEYRERHGDRETIAPFVERFLDAVTEATDGETKRIVDVGCGPGWESATFSERGHDVVGVDLTSAFLQAAREEAPAADLARMDMRSLGLEANTFDGAWVCASFLHVPRDDARSTLEEFRRVLAPGGVLCLSVKRGEGERGEDGYEGDRRRFVLYRPADLRELVSEAGFEVASVESNTSDEGRAWIVLFARA